MKVIWDERLALNRGRVGGILIGCNECNYLTLPKLLIHVTASLELYKQLVEDE